MKKKIKIKNQNLKNEIMKMEAMLYNEKFSLLFMDHLETLKQ